MGCSDIQCDMGLDGYGRDLLDWGRVREIMVFSIVIESHLRWKNGDGNA